MTKTTTTKAATVKTYQATLYTLNGEKNIHVKSTIAAALCSLTKEDERFLTKDSFENEKDFTLWEKLCLELAEKVADYKATLLNCQPPKKQTAAAEEIFPALKMVLAPIGKIAGLKFHGGPQTPAQLAALYPMRYAKIATYTQEAATALNQLRTAKAAYTTAKRKLATYTAAEKITEEHRKKLLNAVTTTKAALDKAQSTFDKAAKTAGAVRYHIAPAALKNFRKGFEQWLKEQLIGYTIENGAKIAAAATAAAKTTTKKKTTAKTTTTKKKTTKKTAPAAKTAANVEKTAPAAKTAATTTTTKTA